MCIQPHIGSAVFWASRRRAALILCHSRSLRHLHCRNKFSKRFKKNHSYLNYLTWRPKWIDLNEYVMNSFKNASHKKKSFISQGNSSREIWTHHDTHLNNSCGSKLYTMGAKKHFSCKHRAVVYDSSGVRKQFRYLALIVWSKSGALYWASTCGGCLDCYT